MLFPRPGKFSTAQPSSSTSTTTSSGGTSSSMDEGGVGGGSIAPSEEHPPKPVTIQGPSIFSFHHVSEPGCQPCPAAQMVNEFVSQGV